MFRLKVCNACEYEIRENYVRQNRLCFPTVGIRASGKTHWLLMLYDQIKNSNIPVASAIRKIPSREDQRFDELVQRLLLRRRARSTDCLRPPLPADVPRPRRRSARREQVDGQPLRLLRRNAELRRSTPNEFRRRALLCEGFTLFLDPTQVSEGSSPRRSRTRSRRLAQFAEEMHAIRGLPAENPIDLPIAVCVSKIDLLVTRNPMGTQAIPLVTALRETLTQESRPVADPRAFAALRRAILPQMFPGWNVERSLRENFGGRYMFFPMSAVGLEEAELGVEDLSPANDRPVRDDRAAALAAPHARLLRVALTTT